MSELASERILPTHTIKNPEALRTARPAEVARKTEVTPVVIMPKITAEKHSLEAARAKKLQKKPIPPLWKDKVEFLPTTTAFLRNCGVEPEYVNPIPIGQGFTHVVFSYQPEGSEPKVIKIPRASTNSFMSTGYHDDLENIALVKKYFGEYAVPTELRLDTKTGKYLYIQDWVSGKPVNHLTETQSVRSQLTDMARLNREMMRQTGQSLDFLGVPGFFSLMRHHIRHIFTAASEFEISNVLVDESGKLKIIDDGLLRLKNVPFVQRMISEFGFMANRLVMKLYFGVSLKPKI